MLAPRPRVSVSLLSQYLVAPPAAHDLSRLTTGRSMYVLAYVAHLSLRHDLLLYLSCPPTDHHQRSTFAEPNRLRNSATARACVIRVGVCACAGERRPCAGRHSGARCADARCQKEPARFVRTGARAGERAGGVCAFLFGVPGSCEPRMRALSPFSGIFQTRGDGGGGGGSGRPPGARAKG